MTDYVAYGTDTGSIENVDQIVMIPIPDGLVDNIEEYCSTAWIHGNYKGFEIHE